MKQEIKYFSKIVEVNPAAYRKSVY